MRRARRSAFGVAIAVSAVACGVSLVGLEPEGTVDAGVDAHRFEPDGGIDARVPIDGGIADADSDADAPCDAGDDLCDMCDPDLVLCVEFDGGLVDRSMYHRTLDVIGTPSFILEDGLGAISLDGSVGLSVAPDPRTEPYQEEALEILVRVRSLPPDGGRYGLVDRNGSASLFLRHDGRITCRELTHTFPPASLIGRFSHVACTVTREGRGALYLDGVVYEEGDATAPEARPGEPTMIGRDDFASDASVLVDLLQGDIATLRIYHRARTAEEVARAAGRDARP